MERVRPTKRAKIDAITVNDLEYVENDTNVCTQCGNGANYHCYEADNSLCSACIVEIIFNL